MGIQLPERCLRKRKDCRALSQIESDCGKSFFCCGHSKRKSRELKRDRFRLCFKNSVIDEMSDNDDKDMHDMASVILQALSIDQHMKDK